MKTEAKLEKDVRKWCQKNGWKRKKMSSPGSRGTLDDYFLKDGRHVWIEMKAPGNTPTELQWIEIDDIRAYGGEAYWCNSLGQVIWILTRSREEVWSLHEERGMLPPQEEWQL